jgi:hypothetical protein
LSANACVHRISSGAMLGPLLTTGPRRAELAKQEQRAQYIDHD